MGAVFGAFVQYLVTFIIFIAVAVAGAFCGKKLHESRKGKKEEQ
jgi:hypothetical protein